MSRREKIRISVLYTGSIERVLSLEILIPLRTLSEVKTRKESVATSSTDKTSKESVYWLQKCRRTRKNGPIQILLECGEQLELDTEWYKNQKPKQYLTINLFRKGCTLIFWSCIMDCNGDSDQPKVKFFKKYIYLLQVSHD